MTGTTSAPAWPPASSSGASRARDWRRTASDQATAAFSPAAAVLDRHRGRLWKAPSGLRTSRPAPVLGAYAGEHARAVRRHLRRRAGSAAAGCRRARSSRAGPARGAPFLPQPGQPDSESAPRSSARALAAPWISPTPQVSSAPGAPGSAGVAPIIVDCSRPGPHRRSAGSVPGGPAAAGELKPPSGRARRTRAAQRDRDQQHNGAAAPRVRGAGGRRGPSATLKAAARSPNEVLWKRDGARGPVDGSPLALTESIGSGRSGCICRPSLVGQRARVEPQQQRAFAGREHVNGRAGDHLALRVATRRTRALTGRWKLSSSVLPLTRRLWKRVSRGSRTRFSDCGDLCSSAEVSTGTSSVSPEVSAGGASCTSCGTP